MNVLDRPAIREGVKAFSVWPTIPQLSVKGEFIAGADIATQLIQEGQLHGLLGVQMKAARPPCLDGWITNPPLSSPTAWTRNPRMAPSLRPKWISSGPPPMQRWNQGRFGSSCCQISGSGHSSEKSGACSGGSAERSP